MANAKKVRAKLRLLVIGIWSLVISSTDDFLHDVACHIGQPEVAAVEAIRQPLVIDAQQAQDRGVHVVDADTIDPRFETDVVGFAVMHAAANAAAGKPGRKRVRVVVAAWFLTLLSHWQPAEL